MLLIFLPLFNFIFIWIIDLLLGKYKAILLIAHSYIILFIFGSIVLYRICILNQFYYYTIGT